jgi:hypothetical protein
VGLGDQLLGLLGEPFPLGDAFGHLRSERLAISCAGPAPISAQHEVWTRPSIISFAKRQGGRFGSCDWFHMKIRSRAWIAAALTVAATKAG